MSPRERMLAIRVLEKVRRNPEYAASLGIYARMEKKDGDARVKERRFSQDAK